MFRRRIPLTYSQRMRNHVWPRMGMRRAVLYMWYRLRRIPDTPSAIAAGFAIGVAMAISPIIGTHMVFALGLAWLVRANFVAAIVGTWVINPWTAPPVWFATYYVGRMMEGLPVLGRANAPSFVTMFKGLTEAALRLDVRLFARDVWPVLKPMILGSIPIGIISALAIFMILRPILATLQSRRTALRMAAAARRFYDSADTG
jgi:uncharacterized protein (DUF2062 family)